MPEPTARQLAAWLRATRSASLLLGPDRAGGRGPVEVVEWFGAMQAQDLPGVLWSLGLRTGNDREAVTGLLDTGAILRTWPMRGTLHLVPGRDARWMVAHFARRSVQQAGPRRDALGLSEADAERACEVLAAALDSGPMTRAECASRLAEAGLPTEGQRTYHLLWYAAARGLGCVGPSRGSEQTFALLDRWAPPGRSVEREEALAILAERFVRSHGPVTRHDLARWADLTLGDVRVGVSQVDGVVEVEAAGRAYYLRAEVLDRFGPPGAAATTPRPRSGPPAHALPGFDELVLGYRDRAAQLDPQFAGQVVPGGNGMFQPTLVVGGRVVGTWRRRELARRVDITARSLVTVPPRDRRSLERALAGYGRYVGRPAEIRWEP